MRTDYRIKDARGKVVVEITRHNVVVIDAVLMLVKGIDGAMVEKRDEIPGVLAGGLPVMGVWLPMSF